MYLSTSILLSLLVVSQAVKDCSSSFKELDIVPNYAEGIKSTKIEVFFDGYRFKCGEEFLVSLAEDPPLCTLVRGHEVHCDLMTILFFSAEPVYLHWIVYNVPTKKMMKGYCDDWGDNGADYEPPVTPNNTTTHVLFFYCQSFEIDEMNKDYFDDLDHRKNFPVLAHAEYYHLNIPEVATFFKLKSDSS